VKVFEPVSTLAYQFNTVTLRLAVSRQSFHLGDNPLRLTTNNLLKINTCGHSPYVTSSLTRGWICRLQLLLVLASAVVLRYESRGTRGHILLFQVRDSFSMEGVYPFFPVIFKSYAQSGPHREQAELWSLLTVVLLTLKCQYLTLRFSTETSTSTQFTEEGLVWKALVPWASFRVR
jgi:hypothetical protein